MVTLMNMLVDRLMTLTVCMVDTKLLKEMMREENCLSFAIKRSCVWQTHVPKKGAQENSMHDA